MDNLVFRVGIQCGEALKHNLKHSGKILQTFNSPIHIPELVSIAFI